MQVDFFLLIFLNHCQHQIVKYFTVNKDYKHKGFSLIIFEANNKIALFHFYFSIAELSLYSVELIMDALYYMALYY